MSIRDRQITNAVDKALKDELQAGRYPDRDTVYKRAHEKFTERTAGLPRFTPIPAPKYQPSSGDDYNLMVTNIREDLDTSFDEIRALTSRILGAANLYETEKLRIEKQIQLLERRVQNLAYRSQNKQMSIFNTFADFKYVDFQGDGLRNIPKTTAFVDLRFGQVTLGNVKAPSTKHDISKALIEMKILSPYKNTTVLSSLDNALKDTINESWRQLITTTVSTTVKVQINIELLETLSVTNLNFIVNSPRATEVAISVSADGTVWQHLNTKTVLSNCEHSFQETKIKFIRILLTKDEPDNSNATAYEYYFGLQNISLIYGQFQDQATFVSQAHPLPSMVNEVTLVADEAVPAATEIRYYVGLDNPAKTISWTEVKNGSTIKFGTYRKEAQSIDLYTENTYGLTHAEQAGVSYHYICQFPYAPKLETIKLMLGPRMWQKDRMQESIFLKTDKANPSAKDWVTTGTATSAFIHSGDNVLPFDDKLFNRFTIYLYSKTETSVKLPVNVLGSVRFATYLNNNLLQMIAGSYIYHFVPGWNKIQVCGYADESGCAVRLNIDFGLVSDQVYANNQPLTLVSAYDLMNNTSKKDFTRFAVVDNAVVINYDPVALDESKSVGVTYHITYDYAPTDQATLTGATGIRLMAVLTRQSQAKNVAPQLREYRLLLS